MSKDVSGNRRMDREEILIAIKKLFGDLGHPPTRREFKERTGISADRVLKYYPSFSDALKEAGLNSNNTNPRISETELLMDWARIARNAGKIPTGMEYQHTGGKFSIAAYKKRFGRWRSIPGEFIERFKDSQEYADIISLIQTAKAMPPRQAADVNASSGDKRSKITLKQATPSLVSGQPTGIHYLFGACFMNPLMSRELFSFSGWWRAK